MTSARSWLTLEVELEFAPPTAALSRVVSVYYRLRMDYPLIDDLERADVGYLRFFLSGKGSILYASGQRDQTSEVTLWGPATETGHYTVTGPLDCFGVVLLPEFWGGILEIDASTCANRCLDAAPLFGPECEALFTALSGMTSIEEMAKATDAFLLRRASPLPPGQVAVIDRIGDWLRGSPIPPAQALYDSIPDLSERSILRIANRHFGAAPKMLARKFRALRTASRIVGTRGKIPPELIAEYSDRAHMTRDIKHFTGLTPRQLQINANPILLTTLHPDNFRADAPWT